MLTLILGHLAGSPCALAQQAARLHVLGRYAQQLGRVPVLPLLEQRLVAGVAVPVVRGGLDGAGLRAIDVETEAVLTQVAPVAGGELWLLEPANGWARRWLSYGGRDSAITVQTWAGWRERLLKSVRPDMADEVRVADAIGGGRE